ncbi:hypothetical protein K1T71_004594 [Dendrolimus kikuchii]|uniref:Uncharacterized protein n=1 Tax=Dendrolimus kikuchii TaxID=765133 RepID=A0ACC1D7V9_9NEOP|nr:hypothetical protein K1T71_004594 [Dendrolimus kikuchii]
MKLLCFLFIIIIVLLSSVLTSRLFRRSDDSLIGSTNLAGPAGLGERDVSECLALGNPPWKCYTEQHGINPQW